MILDNYWKCMAMQNDGDTPNKHIASLQLRGGNGNFYQMINYAPTVEVAKKSIYNFLNGLQTKVGSGDSQPQASDYQLQAEIGNFSNYQTTVTATNDGGQFKIVFLISGINNTGSAKTIREVGIYHEFWTGTMSSDTSINIFLVREVLENPITIPNTQGFVLSFEWVQA